MKMIATEEVINSWLSDIDFHFEIINPIDNSYKLEILKADQSQRAGKLGFLLELLNAIAAYEPDLETFESYSRIRREATQQVFSHVDFEKHSKGREYRHIEDDNELNRILGELNVKTIQYAYDYDAQKYWATYQDLSDKFLMLVAEELFLPEDAKALIKWTDEPLSAHVDHAISDNLNSRASCFIDCDPGVNNILLLGYEGIAHILADRGESILSLATFEGLTEHFDQTALIETAEKFGILCTISPLAPITLLAAILEDNGITNAEELNDCFNNSGPFSKIKALVMLTNISISWPAVYYGCKYNYESSPSFLFAVSAWMTGKLNDTVFNNVHNDFFQLIGKLLYGTASINDAADNIIESVNSITKYDYSSLAPLLVFDYESPDLDVNDQFPNSEDSLANSGFDKGLRAAQSGDFEVALAVWVPLAEQGDVWAQYHLGIMHEYGEGVEENHLKAVHWYSLAAEKGLPSAQFSLGIMYDRGDGVTKSATVAVKWLTLAAEQGEVKAQASLGGMYTEGDGVPINFKTAFKWTELAAKQGHASCQCNLGTMYDQGQGVLVDYERALMWYLIAAGNGNNDDCVDLVYRNKKIISDKMTFIERTKAEQMCEACFLSDYTDC